jgi:hypothetical protein
MSQRQAGGVCRQVIPKVASIQQGRHMLLIGREVKKLLIGLAHNRLRIYRDEIGSLGISWYKYV